MTPNADQVESLAQGADALLEDYGVYVDHDVAVFIKHYLKSLMLDFELAMTRGEAAHMRLVTSMMQELIKDARLRVDEAKDSFLKAGSPNQTAITPMLAPSAKVEARKEKRKPSSTPA